MRRVVGPTRNAWGVSEGVVVEVFSDGSVTAPRGQGFQVLRRPGSGAAWGPAHTSNFAAPLAGPVQTIGRAELHAAIGVIQREPRPPLLRIDNQWVVHGLQILLKIGRAHV